MIYRRSTSSADLVPYGQPEVDRMVELDISPVELEALRDGLQSAARAAMELAGGDLICC